MQLKAGQIGKIIRIRACAIAAGLAVAHCMIHTQSPGNLQATHFHLAPRTEHVSAITTEAMLDRLEGLCRFTVQWQDTNGAILDPYLHRDFQYATPYFAFAVGTLVSAHRAPDLLSHGIAAMENATRQIGEGRSAIPDSHGEFFLASLTEALPVYKNLVPEATWMRWSDRLCLPIAQIIGARQLGNWRTYAMKGEWQRAKLGLVSHDEAESFIEENWKQDERGRFATAPISLYHDRSSDPDTLSVALVGEGNLLSILLEGYDGPSAAEIRTKVLDALRTTLLLVDPTGQVPANGRTDDHLWTEVGLQLAFTAAAPMFRAEGDERTADAMEREAQLSFEHMERWRRNDGKWAGSYYITKNYFDPTLRVGYQNASQYSNYTGALMFHLAEMYRLSRGKSPADSELASPAEIGGYAVLLDPQFATAFANAGGLQIQFNLRGETEEANDNWWTPLGAVRIARAGWDTRLGPSDGAQTSDAAASFAPEILRSGRWIRLAELPKDYEAAWSVQLVNPAIVRCTVEYHPLPDHGGISFRDRFTITPDGVLSTVEALSHASADWGVTWPLLVNDGRPLRPYIGKRIAETSYNEGGDTESFLALNQQSALDATWQPVRSTYGDLLPVRMSVTEGASHTFVYPHNSSQPSSTALLNSFALVSNGFRSILGRVTGDVYVGTNYAGGKARNVDLDGDGVADLKFNRECKFVAQMHNGVVTCIETDRPVTARLNGKTYRLKTYLPLTISR